MILRTIWWVRALDCAVAVVALVILLILAALDVRGPGGIRPVPLDGLVQTVFERHASLPASFAHQFLAGESITAVVSGAILHRLHQAFGLFYRGQDLAYHVEIRQRPTAADVVDFPGAATLDHRQDGASMVVHVQ